MSMSCKKEMVNHPDHYNKEGRPECIDEMVQLYGVDFALIWCIMTAHKYCYRIGDKDAVEQELGKIEWYENWVRSHIDMATDRVTVDLIWNGYLEFNDRL